MVTVAVPRTCYRCGAEFPQYNRERVCRTCRKPRICGRKTIEKGSSLSVREKQIVHLVVEGKLNKEIAFDLHLTAGTVKEYLHRIFRKVRVQTRTQLAVWSIRNTP